MKVLIAPDKFKGTLSADEAAAAMAEGVARFSRDWQVVKLPIADGGEGTAELLARASGGSMVNVRASDPLMRSIGCTMGYSADGATAFIDMAAASGFASLDPQDGNPLKTSSLGTGQLIVHALTRKCKRIIVGLGGTSTIDCGMGIAHALGVVFMGEAGARLSPIGASLGKVEFISLDNLRPELKKVELLLLADVDNPLLGEEGAMFYAAQKGLATQERSNYHAALTHFSNFVEVKLGTVSKTPGMGAAGGAALCCVSLLRAKMARGADFVLEALQAQQAIDAADLVLTGEGHLDAQSLHGKASVALARLAQAQGKHVAAICGQVSLDASAQRGVGIDLAAALFPVGVDMAMARRHAREALVEQTLAVLQELAPRLG